MEKRLIAAIALSLLVLLSFQWIIGKKTEPAPTQQAVQSEQKHETMTVPTQLEPQTKNKTDEYAAPTKENTTDIETNNLILTFSDIGGSIKKVVLKTTPQNSKTVIYETLYDEKNPEKRIFAMSDNQHSNLSTRQFVLSQGSDYLEYTVKEPGKIEIQKKYSIDRTQDVVNTTISVKNLSKETKEYYYQVIGPSSLAISNEVDARNFLQMDTLVGTEIWKIRATKGKIKQKAGDIAWIGIKNKYYTIACKPFGCVEEVFVGEQDNNLVSSLKRRTETLYPEKEINDKYLFHSGILNQKQLAKIGYSLQDLVDYGFFGGISKLLLSILAVFHKVTNNWGLAIILLTLVMNIILFPLTMKSLTSMHQMKKVQPHINKLRDLHKDDPQRLNKEMLELYKQYNINPIGGCLPMLLQMPVFIALYQGLIRSVELKGAQFLWIKDLSRPEHVPIPFTLPLLGNSINILPIVMIIVMVIQQKVSQFGSPTDMSPEQRNQQRMMTVVMPVVFGFIFYGMPSGLVLYWLTNTILMVGEQKLIGSRMDKE
ncbi:MAG: membrane protein insertase YidC [Candidatus Omnitrophica bacterium]|nr:membrane protein insertase YidC [Candidatus Omnitrophota bacterium]